MAQGHRSRIVATLLSSLQNIESHYRERTRGNPCLHTSKRPFSSLVVVSGDWTLAGASSSFSVSTAETRNFWSVYACRESKGHFRRIIWMGERNGSRRSGNVLRARNSRLLGSFARTCNHEVTTNRSGLVRACNFTRPDVATRTRRRRNDWTISAYAGVGRVLRPSKSERSRPCLASSTSRWKPDGRVSRFDDWSKERKLRFDEQINGKLFNCNLDYKDRVAMINIFLFFFFSVILGNNI